MLPLIRNSMIKSLKVYGPDYENGYKVKVGNSELISLYSICHSPVRCFESTGN